MYVVLEAMEKNTIYLIIGCKTGKNKKLEFNRDDDEIIQRQHIVERKGNK